MLVYAEGSGRSVNGVCVSSGISIPPSIECSELKDMYFFSEP